MDKRHREELLLQLIRESELNDRQLISIAQRLDLDLEQPRVAAIIKLHPNKAETLSLEHLQSMVHLLEYLSVTTWSALLRYPATRLWC